MTCGEHSSGDKDNRTSITKQENTISRKAFVDVQSLSERQCIYKKSTRLKARQNGMKKDIIAYADRTKRLMRKYN
ncbi:hypothetical protein DWW36_01440 [Erysipelotrichaceae bacterium AF15-26LB]|nr:hypothetical protein DWX45_04905 [Erysipelotrichaceae bacterium AF19-24AC]RJV93105.1 hypothetical protein DWW36_01440 [Erysipelotrichaceae bacterium AF15-26LB]